jgi:hypothetical protein
VSDLQKAKIFKVDKPSDSITVQFNPKDFSITRAIEWVDRAIGGTDVSQKDFAGGKAQDLRVELWFDSTDTGSDVRKKYQKLLDLSMIDSRKVNQKTKKGQPPEVKFQWGSYLSFTGVITQITQTFVMFKRDGTPVRAKLDVTFSESEQKVKGQNPTTRRDSRKIRVVHQGERLDWIAYQEFGDPAYWRHIAEVNEIDNPENLYPGQILRITPVE